MVAGLLVGVAAVSSAAILIRLADAPAVSIAFWRTFGGAAVLAPFAVRARRGRPLGRRARRLVAASGALLAAHFALWVASLSLTTVASAVTLVTVSPLFVGLGAWWLLAERPARRTWVGMGLTIVGALVIGLADAGSVRLDDRALLGDAMAFGGALAITGYLLIGRLVRREVANTVYAAGVYGVAAAVLLVAALASGSALGGYDAGTWLALAGMVAGPQLLGHTVFNGLLATVSATVVSIVVLAEPVGATLLAWLVLDELPVALFWAGAPLILVGVFVATRARGAGASSPAVAAATD